jgi:hypothetical protein
MLRSIRRAWPSSSSTITMCTGCTGISFGTDRVRTNPIEPFRDGTSALAYLLGPDGSGQVHAGRPLLIAAEVVAALDLALVVGGGEDHHRRAAQVRVRLHRLQDVSMPAGRC